MSDSQVSRKLFHGFVVEYIIDKAHAFVRIECASIRALWRHDSRWFLASAKKLIKG